MTNKNKSFFAGNKIFLYASLATSITLLLPLIAMQFTSEVNWGTEDFAVMGVLIFGVSSLFVFAAKKIHKKTHQIVASFLFLLTFLWLWAELAVGIFTNWGS